MDKVEKFKLLEKLQTPNAPHAAAKETTETASETVKLRHTAVKIAATGLLKARVQVWRICHPRETFILLCVFLK
jgi:hypothetical protein